MSRVSNKRQQFKGIELPHIGKILKKYIKDNRLHQVAWARKQGVQDETIIGYFKKSTMQTSTLFDICQILKYNFIREIADALPADMPPHPINPLQQKLDENDKEIEKLKYQIEILEKMVTKQ